MYHIIIYGLTTYLQKLLSNSVTGFCVCNIIKKLSEAILPSSILLRWSMGTWVFGVFSKEEESKHTPEGRIKLGKYTLQDIDPLH